MALTNEYIQQKLVEKFGGELTEWNDTYGMLAFAMPPALNLKVMQYLRDELESIPQLDNVRGRGLMIGFDVPESLKDLKKNLLWNQKVFTGESKPNVIRLLPSLALKKKDAEQFIDSIKEEIGVLEPQNS